MRDHIFQRQEDNSKIYCKITKHFSWYSSVLILYKFFILKPSIILHIHSLSILYAKLWVAFYLDHAVQCKHMGSEESGTLGSINVSANGSTTQVHTEGLVVTD